MNIIEQHIKYVKYVALYVRVSKEEQVKYRYIH